MYNAEATIERCLTPLRAMLKSGEVQSLCVVSDCSTDGSEELVKGYEEITLLRTEQQGGPGGARNLAAQTQTVDYLWFVDADVIVADDAARILRQTLLTHQPTAVMGSYDLAPDAQNFLSQYKNLVHHYYHQGGNDNASTFWAGCGAVLRTAFLDVGGFDVTAYPYPSIEDIDLGYRLRAKEGRIMMIKDLQGKHLKEWRFKGLVHTEIFRRAIPWSRLMLSREGLTDDLNVGRGERVRAALAGLTVLSVLAFLVTASAFAMLVMLGVTVLANLNFIRFFTRRKGPTFALRAFFFHQFYYLYSAAAFVYALTEHHFGFGQGRRD